MARPARLERATPSSAMRCEDARSGSRRSPRGKTGCFVTIGAPIPYRIPHSMAMLTRQQGGREIGDGLAPMWIRQQLAKRPPEDAGSGIRVGQEPG